MSTETERTANEAAVAELIQLAAHDQPAAARYLEILAGAARVLDDIYDGDHPVSREAAISAFYGALVELPQNEFWQKHCSFLTALHFAALNAWLDANQLARRGRPLDVVYAHVLRDQINELLPAVAQLTGGWELARRVSLRMRDLFAKDL